MARTLQELSRVVKKDGRVVFVVGHESRVLGVPFYNADMLEQLAIHSGLFGVVIRQQRVFCSRFGKQIREDILNLQRIPSITFDVSSLTLGRTVARVALESAIIDVPEKNSMLLQNAIDRIDLTEGTPLFDGSNYSRYQIQNV